MGGQFLHRLPQGAIAEVALGNAEKLGPLPAGTKALEFVERAAQNPIGRVVKLADLEENSDLSRIASPSWEDLERIEKYRRAIGRLRA